MKIAKVIALSVSLVFACLLFIERSPVMAQSNTSAETTASSESGNLTLEDLFHWRSTSVPNYDRLLYERIKSINKRTVRINGIVAIGLGFLVPLNLIIVFFLIRSFYRQRALENILSIHKTHDFQETTPDSSQANLATYLPSDSTDRSKSEIDRPDVKFVKLKEPVLPIIAEMLRDYLNNADRSRINKLIKNQNSIKQVLQELKESMTGKSENLEHERRILDLLETNIKASQIQVDKDASS